MNILVTGASGFVGGHLCDYLIKHNVKFKAVVRKNINTLVNYQLIFDQIDAQTNWKKALEGVDVVIHLAGRAHVMDKSTKESYQEYASINVEATKNLAMQAAECGVKRFIFTSSIGVNGNSSETPINEAQHENPQEHYAVSKYEAEKVLRVIASETNLDVVVIRPPLVYGLGVKANFKKLIMLSELKFPLPFGAIDNKRSLIYVENLIDFIMLCVTHPKAAIETFLVSDDDDVSTTKLIQTVAGSEGNKPLLMPVSPTLLKIIFFLFGKKTMHVKLCCSLYADIAKAKSVLGWKPPFSLKQGIHKTMQDK